MPTKPNARRISPADLPPELRAKYEQARAKAATDRHLDGPPPPQTDPENSTPCYFALRSLVGQLRKAREAGGLSAAEVARRTGIAAETISRLETGALVNPTYATLARYAVAVGCELELGVRPAKKKSS